MDFPNPNCFAETPPGSGLYSCTATAYSGRTTYILLVPVIIQTDGSTNVDDRQKGIFIETEDPTHELTVIVDIFSAEFLGGHGSYMAINCVEFPTARDYQYFVFSSDSTSESFGGSQFLITPCEDNTSISVRPSQPISHPDWVSPSIASTDPSSTTGQDMASYGQTFNRFDTLLFSNIGDLTGSIVISDKPVSVFVGHLCGSLAGAGCGYLVEQVPPYPTYGDLFFIFDPFSGRQTYRIGSVTDGAQVTINCNCSSETPSGNTSVALQSSEPGVLTATVNRGQYVQCTITSGNACCIQSNQPVTVMKYNGVVDMTYIPPATSYLSSYSVFSYHATIIYILPTTVFDNSVEDQNRFTINDEVYIPDEYVPISCYVNGSSEVCAYGSAFLSSSRIDRSIYIEYKNIGSEAFLAYYDHGTLSFEMEPVGCEFSLV